MDLEEESARNWRQCQTLADAYDSASIFTVGRRTTFNLSDRAMRHDFSAFSSRRIAQSRSSFFKTVTTG